MAFPTASGYPNRSGTFIPELWSGKLIEKFYDSTVLAAISNTDYEGEIKKYGDKVNIRTRASVTIRDYQKGQALQVEHPESPTVELLIDKGKYFNCIEDDIDVVQSDINLMNLWSQDASEQMKIVIDRDVLGSIYADVAASNTGATAGRISKDINLGATGAAVSLDKTNILDKIVDLGIVLDEANIPETGRWLLLPAWAAGMLKKSDLKDASITGDGTSVMRNGRLGQIDRFTIYTSNLLPSVQDTGKNVFNIMAGHKAALTFASQMTKMENLRGESTFGTLVRGLQVYGYEVVKGDAMARLYAFKA